jgi:hypothetical protein
MQRTATPCTPVRFRPEPPFFTLFGVYAHSPAGAGRLNMRSYSFMFTPERTLRLLVALGMFIFSMFIYRESGDWVAAIFALGSLCYFVFFLLVYKRNNQ